MYDFVDEYSSAMNNMVDTFMTKNKLYGDSFCDQCDEFGFLSAEIRITDKYKRMRTIADGKVPSDLVDISHESLTDTLLDMANYCIMAAAWLNLRKE